MTSSRRLFIFRFLLLAGWVQKSIWILCALSAMRFVFCSLVSWFLILSWAVHLIIRPTFSLSFLNHGNILEKLLSTALFLCSTGKSRKNHTKRARSQH
ncbi:hypothetical protein BT63DRAFT_292053 [Microthyrium microscopicum]|uniref:Uncharacterized protein n=1 Tax=Microthyrium microscopicum TaxID=703497 RepID=A0A6A6U568_9PEZI|nr:hypothetical protein BT63DRAFT_292053 [Microthyrium microscopicum]